MQYKQGYDEFELDILKEVGNIGSGHASVAMSKITNLSSHISHTSLELIPPKNLIERELTFDSKMDVLHRGIEGDIRGDSLILFYGDSSNELVKLIREFKENKHLTGNSDVAIIHEFATMLVNYYLDALSKFVNLDPQPKQSGLKSSFTRNFQEIILKNMELNPLKDAMVIKTKLKIVDQDVSAAIIMMFTRDTIGRILNRTKLKNVLVLDSDSSTAAKIKDIYGERTNVKVYTAKTVDDAFKLFNDVSPNLCFIKNEIDGQKGLDLIYNLKEVGKNSNFVLVGKSSSDSDDEFHKLGIKGCLKNISNKKLIIEFIDDS